MKKLASPDVRLHLDDDLAADLWRRLADPVGMLGLSVAMAVVVLVATFFTAQVVYADKVLPNTRVGGIELGGLTIGESRARLETAARRMAIETVVFTHEVGSWNATYEQLGVSLDVPALQAEVQRIGHRSSAIANAADWLRAVSGGVTLAAAHRADTNALDRYVGSVAALADRAPIDGAVNVSTAGIATDAAVIGARLDREDLRAQVLDPGLKGRSVIAAVEPVEPGINEASVARALALARAATRPLTLVLDGQALPIPIERVRALVYVAADNGQLVLRWPDATMNVVVMMAMERFDRPARAAELLPGADRLEVVPGQEGVIVDTDGLRYLIGQSVNWQGAGRVIDVPVWRVPAALTTQQAGAIASQTRLLGGFTTYFPVNYARAINIGLAASAFDGQAVGPGEHFSFWDRIGEVSGRAGYLDAGAIIDGVSSTAIGGGLCQVSTTLFNAVALAGYQVDERHPHSYYIERYPVGRDAAVFLGSQDFRWTNDTTTSAYLRASATGTSITFWLYGSSERAVEISAAAQSNLRWPAADQPADPQHAPGYVVAGRDTSVTRTITEGGSVRRETWISRYAPVWGGPIANR